MPGTTYFPKKDGKEIDNLCQTDFFIHNRVANKEREGGRERERREEESRERERERARKRQS